MFGDRRMLAIAADAQMRGDSLAFEENLDRPALKISAGRALCLQRMASVGSALIITSTPTPLLQRSYRFARAEVDVRMTARTVEIFLEGERIAAHLRRRRQSQRTTIPEHMPCSTAAMRAGR